MPWVQSPSLPSQIQSCVLRILPQLSAASFAFTDSKQRWKRIKKNIKTRQNPAILSCTARAVPRSSPTLGRSRRREMPLDGWRRPYASVAAMKHPGARPAPIKSQTRSGFLDRSAARRCRDFLVKRSTLRRPAAAGTTAFTLLRINFKR